MAKKTPKDIAEKTLQSPDYEAMRVRAVARNMEFMTHEQEIDRWSVGTVLNVPPQLKSWHFCRCDVHHAINKQTYEFLLRFGYDRAPPDVRFAGFRDDEATRYLMCPPEILAKRMEIRERKARQLQGLVPKKFQQDAMDLRGMLSSGSTVEATESVTQHTVQAPDVTY